MRSNGYTHVGRYTVGADKFITSGELDAIRSSGLKLVPLHQRYNDSASTMTYAAGQAQGLEALERGRVLGLPSGSVIFFSVDFDPEGETIHGPVTDFFRGIASVIASALNGSFKVGVYGTRNVCQILLDDGKAQGAFVAGMSTGYSGNMGFPMPSKWHYNQVVEVSESLGGSTLGIDHDVVSTRAAAVDLAAVTSPPVERDGSSTATGFDVFFEWICRAEVACERAVAHGSSPVRAWSTAIPDFILHWLRRPGYWSAAWQVYTAVADPDADASTARSASEAALSSLSPTKPACKRDYAHFAATTLGYRQWGVPTTLNSYGLGDLGGWGLDLLSSFGVYQKLSPVPDLWTWMTTNLGKDVSKCGLSDIVADADAWFVARALGATSGATLSGVLRGLLAKTPAQRIKNFYQERFGSSETNVAAAFARIADGIDVGSVQNFPLSDEVYRRLADVNPPPTPAQAQLCGRAFAQVLVRLGS